MVEVLISELPGQVNSTWVPAEVQRKSRVTELGEVSIPGSLPKADHSSNRHGPSRSVCKELAFQENIELISLDVWLNPKVLGGSGGTDAPFFSFCCRV